MHLETQPRSLALYHELLDVLNSIMPSLLIHMFDPDVSQQMDGLIEGILDSFAIYRGKDSNSRDTTDVTTYKNQVSPFMEKVNLIPVQDFINIFSILKDLSKQKIVISEMQTTYPNTLSLFLVLVDEIVEEEKEIDQVLG